MRSLFARFFLTFWLALALFTLCAVVLVSHSLEVLRDQERSQLRAGHHRVAAQQMAAKAGIEGLRRWARQIDAREALPFFVVDRQGSDLLGRKIPEALLEHRRYRGFFAADAGDAVPDRRRPLSVIEVDPQNVFLLIPDVTRLTFARLLQRPNVYLGPLLLGLLISAVACGLLTLYLVKPLRELRKAVNACANGDFDSHISPLFVKRNDEIAALARDVDLMSQAIRDALQSQRQLLHDVSHEFRSPLARMQVAAELAELRTDLNQRELARIKKEIETLDRLVGELLAVERINVNSTLPGKRVDLSQIIEMVVSDARFEAESIGKRVELSAETGLYVLGEESLLQRAVENVIRNALQYSPPDSVVKVVVNRAEASRVQIQVEDAGPGVPESQLVNMFKPFVRMDESRNVHTGGFGLGLAITERAVKRHGGAIAACNLSPTGFRITIELPLQQ